MNISDPLFYPDMLNNSFGLEKVMEGKEAIQRIEKKSQNLAFISTPARIKPIGGLEIFITSTKAPIQAIFSVFLRGIAYFLNSLQFLKASRIFTVFSLHMRRDWEQLCDRYRFEAPLVPAFCHPHVSSWDTYGTEATPVDCIEDPAIKKMTFFHCKQVHWISKAMDQFHLRLEKVKEKNSGFFQFWKKLSAGEKQANTQIFTELYTESSKKAFQYLMEKYPHDSIEEPLRLLYDDLKYLDHSLTQNYSQVSLFSDHSLSRGASIWFANLVLKTRHLFNKNPDKHLVAVAEQFRTGIPRQGIIAQALCHPEALMKIKFNDLDENRISLFELDSKQKSAKEKIKQLNPGIYRVDVNQHSLVYVKINDTEEYVWNPYFGLYKMGGDKMFQMILKYYYKPGIPTSQISFYQYQVDARTDEGVV